MQNLPIKQLIKDFSEYFQIRHKNDNIESLQVGHKDKHKRLEIKIKITLEKAFDIPGANQPSKHANKIEL